VKRTDNGVVVPPDGASRASLSVLAAPESTRSRQQATPRSMCGYSDGWLKHVHGHAKHRAHQRLPGGMSRSVQCARAVGRYEAQHGRETMDAAVQVKNMIHRPPHRMHGNASQGPNQRLSERKSLNWRHTTRPRERHGHLCTKSTSALSLCRLQNFGVPVPAAPKMGCRLQPPARAPSGFDASIPLVSLSSPGMDTHSAHALCDELVCSVCVSACTSECVPSFQALRQGGIISA
jgi:hypothetical protein